MKEKIIELRKLVPVPMGEAMKLLKENDADVSKCVAIYKDACIDVIQEATGCDKELAQMYYEQEKYDLNRTISFVKDELFDRSYQPIEGLTVEGLNKAAQWINFMQAEDFGTSLTYVYISDVVYTLSLIPALQGASDLLSDASDVYKTIFEGYTDAMALEEFVKRNRRLDDEPAFINANSEIPLRMTVMKEELQRHGRNMVK